VLTIIVPRHPENRDAIARNLAPWRTARRSAGEPIAPTTAVYLADSLNELGLFLRLADVAVVGKSFARQTGGHNPLEPARLGVGVLSGPDVSVFADIYPELVEAGAARIVADEGALAAALAELLADPARLAAMGEAGRAYGARQSGALEAALERIRPLLPAA
jgi:3-deoxy-D-manno-octulosonic-acid transferase